MSDIVHQIKSKRLHAQEPIHWENPIFLIGKNMRGNWVVQTQKGRCCGLCASKT